MLNYIILAMHGRCHANASDAALIHVEITYKYFNLKFWKGYVYPSIGLYDMPIKWETLPHKSRQPKANDFTIQLPDPLSVFLWEIV